MSVDWDSFRKCKWCGEQSGLPCRRMSTAGRGEPLAEPHESRARKSAADPGAARGVQPSPPARCECAHLVALHVPNSKGMRARCQQCDCARFVAAGAVSGRG